MLTGFRRGQIFVWQHLWIERRVVAEVLPLKTLAVDFVFLRELVSFWRVKSVELANGLGRERLTIHQEQNASDQL